MKVLGNYLIFNGDLLLDPSFNWWFWYNCFNKVKWLNSCNLCMFFKYLRLSMTFWKKILWLSLQYTLTNWILLFCCLGFFADARNIKKIKTLNIKLDWCSFVFLWRSTNVRVLAVYILILIKLTRGPQEEFWT